MTDTLKDIIAQRDELNLMIKRMSAERGSTWMPEVEQEYWFIKPDGAVCLSMWGESEVDKALSDMGNVYLSKQTATHERDKQRARVSFQRLAAYAWDEHNKPLNWHDADQRKFHACYNHFEREWDVFSSCTGKFIDVICFPTIEALKKAIATMGDDMELLK